MATSDSISHRQARPLSFAWLRSGVISLIFIASFFVKFEPAPTDVLALVGLILFAGSGLYFARSFAMPILFMVIYLLAGVVSTIAIERPHVIPYPDDPLQYSKVTAFISLSCILIAAYVAANPTRHFRQIEKAWLIGATIGSGIGIALYMNFTPLLVLFKSIGEPASIGYAFRVVGGYKDPNVFSTWLVFPVVTMTQGLLLGRFRLNAINLSAYLLNTVALLLAFSRGAWFDVAVAAALTVGLSILLTPSLAQRNRAVIYSVLGLIIVVGLLAALMSVPSLNAAFVDRFVLVKSYDSGETGRFGNQINSLFLLLRMPMGLGPYQFHVIFGEAPHNTFLNSFASGGWIGGMAYILWCITTIYMGIRVVVTRSPFQAIAIPVVTTFAIMTLQGLQIDNEHWRHWFWMMGLIWGLYAAMQHSLAQGVDRAALLAGWNVKA